MLSFDSYIRPLVVTAAGLAVGLLDYFVFFVLAGGKMSGIGFLGIGVAIAGVSWMVGIWRERREAIRWLEDQERAARIERYAEELGRGRRS